jgi:NADPH:quinone reductase-like Zn-dependent oxidoreductase
MKAIIYETYGPPEVLQLKEIEKPIPKNNEILIKIFATTATTGDWRVRSLTVPNGMKLIMRLVFGFNKPRQPILGSELSGIVESIGKDVTKFKVGDSVFAFSDVTMGCYVEYKSMPEKDAIAIKPENLSYEEAAALSFGGTTALSFLKRGEIQKRESILIVGASGCVGTATIQIAKHFGAKVTAVCSGKNIDLVKSIGADEVIDYTKEDFTKNGKTYDLIMDTVGTYPFSMCKNSLKEKGRFLMVFGGLFDMLKIPFQSLTTGKKVIAGPALGKAEDLLFLAELAKSGKYKPVIDRVYPLEKMVEAHTYVDTGRKKGNIVITLK